MASLAPLMVKNYFALGAGSSSIVETVFGIGMFAGGLILSRRGGFKKKQYTMFFSALLVGITLTLGGFVPVSRFIPYVILCGIQGIVGPFMMTTTMVIFQTNFKPELLGRIMSLMFTVITLVAPVGLLIATPIIETRGIEIWLRISGIALIGLAACGMLYPKLRKVEV